MSGHRQVGRDHRGWEYLIFGSRNSSHWPAGLGQHQPVGFKQMGTGALHKHPASIHHNPDVFSVAPTQEMPNELQGKGEAEDNNRNGKHHMKVLNATKTKIEGWKIHFTNSGYHSTCLSSEGDNSYFNRLRNNHFTSPLLGAAPW